MSVQITYHFCVIQQQHPMSPIVYHSGFITRPSSDPAISGSYDALHEDIGLFLNWALGTFSTLSLSVVSSSEAHRIAELEVELARYASDNVALRQRLGG